MRRAPMRDLNIIVTTADAERLRGALILACAHAASGGRASLFLQLEAVSLLKQPISAPRDDAHKLAGLPTLADLIAEARALGVHLTACQSGLALCHLTPHDLPQGMDVGGPVSFLHSTGDEARLLIA